MSGVTGAPGIFDHEPPAVKQPGLKPAILAANVVFKLNPVKPQLDFKAALWLPFYLVGTGLIVYLSDFGPLENPSSRSGGTWSPCRRSASRTQSPAVRWRRAPWPAPSSRSRPTCGG
jgi:hypothetical protein